MATRFDYRNLAGQCKEENCSEGGKSYEGGIATDTNFGKRTAQQLFKLSTNYEASVRRQPFFPVNDNQNSRRCCFVFTK